LKVSPENLPFLVGLNMYEKILVPVDGSPTSTLGLQEAIKLATLTGAKVKLFHVIDETSFMASLEGGIGVSAEMLTGIKLAGAQVLKDAVTQLEIAGVKVESELIESYFGRVSDLVLDQAREWGANLIVLGTHGRRGVKRMLLGSDAEQILRLATVPVLLVRGQ
jgi:nucleotide-binding universal stress UspA family protein